MLMAIGVDPDSVIGTSPAETQLAFRRRLEARAADRPQVVVIDDLQWAEPVFVDIVEHIADLSRDAPIFLLCVARTELLDLRPGWGGGKLNATSLLLEPLGAEECAELMGRLVSDGGHLDDGLRQRITIASAGNPLYVEEMLAMVREHGGDGEIAVPPTIHALLQARIDSLDGDVRVVMERGSVEGEVFHRGAVAELSPDLVRPAVESHLATLVRKELIRSTLPTFPEDEGFRFRHLLIRDAAYESLPKATRAELHERFSDWLSTHDLVESDEIVGYHLEQAHRYRVELDPLDASAPTLAAQAASHLAAAGRGALERGDFNAGLSLLRRASALYGAENEGRLALVPDLVVAMWEAGELEEARRLLVESRSATDPVLRAIVAVVDVVIDSVSAGALSSDERAAKREEARAVLESAGHDEGLALYWWSAGAELWNACQTAEAVAAAERGLAHCARSGPGRTDDFVWWIRAAYVSARRRCQRRSRGLLRIRGRKLLDTLQSALTLNSLGRLLAMQGDLDKGRELHRGAKETFAEAGLVTTAAGMSMSAAWIEQRAGDLKAWEESLRSGLAELGAFGDRNFYPTVAGYLAQCLYLQGHFDEARDLCATVRQVSPADDVINFVYADLVEGGLLAQEGSYGEAAAQARRSVERADTTDYNFARAESRLTLGEVLALGGKHDDARRAARDGLALLAAKGDVMAAARARERLDEVGIEVA